MKDKIKYAFPVMKDGETYDPGMHLRDWFAGQALSSLKEKEFSSVENVADRAYEIADAMMKRREQS